jgi:hypothetical protein
MVDVRLLDAPWPDNLNPATVPFYEHFGFVVTEEFDIGPVQGWAMLRQPQPV